MTDTTELANVLAGEIPPERTEPESHAVHPQVEIFSGRVVVTWPRVRSKDRPQVYNVPDHVKHADVQFSGDFAGGSALLLVGESGTFGEMDFALDTEGKRITPNVTGFWHLKDPIGIRYRPKVLGRHAEVTIEMRFLETRT